MSECLLPEGVFCGSFLGPLDSMAGPTYDKSALWPEVAVFDKTDVKGLFESFEIRRFTEHQTSGQTPRGDPHDWHIFSVVAKKTRK